MYESYFGLTGKPFQLNPDPSFYYASKGHKQAFAYLQYGLYAGEGFIVLTGEVGAGKTTLVRSLLEQLDPNKVAAAHIVSSQLQANDLLHTLSIAFGLGSETREKAVLLARLEAYFVALAARNRRALLIVDEAQNLPGSAIEELRMLSNFQLGSTALLQSFLIGQPELRDLLRSPVMQQLRQRVLAAYHLGPLGADETKAYIQHRLSLVKYHGDPTISDEAYDAIFQVTRGIPRNINTLCNRLFVSCYLNEKHEIDLNEVNNTAREMFEEIGVGTVPGMAAAEVEPSHAAVTAASASAHAAAMQVGASAGAGLSEADARLLMGIELRLARLEKVVGATHDLVQKVLGAPDLQTGEPKKQDPAAS